MRLPPKTSQRKKPKMNNPIYFSSLCLIIRDENKYLKEWLIHHLPLTDHIFLYDNGARENVSVITKSLPEPAQSKITVIPFKNGYEHIQEEAYNHFLDNYGRKTVWCAFIDSDEFITIDCKKTIHEILSEKSQYSEVRMFWVEYGADGRVNYDSRPVQERFQTPAEGADMRIRMYKSFIKTEKTKRMVSHFPIFDLKDRLCYIDDKMEFFHIKHYYTKSFEEWKEKMARGSANPRCLKKFDEFFSYNPDMAYLKNQRTDLPGQSYNAGHP